MRRRLFNFGALVSLLLCLATVGLWVQSYKRWMYKTYLIKAHARPAYNEFTLTAVNGSAVVGYIEEVFAPSAAQTGPGLDKAMLDFAGWKNWYMPLFRPGFSFSHEHHGIGVRLSLLDEIGGVVVSTDAYTIALPLWAVVPMTAIAPLVWFAKSAQRFRPARKLGHCSRCGYSLIGNMSGVCPECGTAVAENA